MARKKAAQSSGTPTVVPQVPIAPIVHAANLIEIRLLSCKASIGEMPEQLHQHVGTGVNLDESEKTLGVLVKCAISESPPDADGHPVQPESGFYVEAQFGIKYGLMSIDGITEEMAAAFANANALFNIWPYWREFAQSTSMRMGVGPIVIELLKAPMFRRAMPGPAAAATEAPSRPAKKAPVKKTH